MQSEVGSDQAAVGTFVGTGTRFQPSGGARLLMPICMLLPGFASTASLGCTAPTRVPGGESDSGFAGQPSKESGIIEETERGSYAPTR